jgi:hypothetical protein
MRICETSFCICGFLFRQIFLLRNANNKPILRQSQALWVKPRSTYNSPTWVSDRRGLPFSVMLAALEVKMWYRGDLSHIYLFDFSMYICEGVPLNCLRYSPCLDEYKYLDLQGSGTPIADFVDRFLNTYNSDCDTPLLMSWLFLESYKLVSNKRAKQRQSSQEILCYTGQHSAS